MTQLVTNPHPELGEEYVEPTWADRISYVGRLLWRDKAGMVGLAIFLILVFTAIFAEQIAPFDPLQQNLSAAKTPPAWQEGGSFEHILGTDNLGKDVFSRIVFGSRVSITVGFFGVLIASSLGMLIGLLAGYLGGWVDSVLMGFINLILSIPYLVLVIVIAAVLGRSLLNVVLIFGFTDSPIFARLTRGEVLRIRKSGYVESAVSIGASNNRILFDHILPNLIGPLITLATFEMSAMIFYESGLSFLGLSVPPTTPSWGNMLTSGRQYLTIYPWMAIFPGVAIAMAALGMNLFGDWLRDVLDPRLRRSRK
jgi:ABC-type dipeptide/oligopeptide/nickel transport system permease subunit